MDGMVYVIECALERDGVTSPAAQALDLLEAGMLTPDPDRTALTWPDEDQPHDFIKLMGMFKVLADDGIPTHQNAVNSLEDGIWEFKQGVKRMSFFDTDGDGTFEPKLRILNRADSPAASTEYWWFPDFDDFIRLGHFFVKEGPLAGQEDIDETLRIRQEDLSHDEY
ncbi:MAG: hypothetical protein JWN70_2582 [Planctomycetaceae bacterium]|nr:hypothetical protein [Planctomycetaceae bacterium]